MGLPTTMLPLPVWPVAPRCRSSAVPGERGLLNPSVRPPPPPGPVRLLGYVSCQGAMSGMSYLSISVRGDSSGVTADGPGCRIHPSGHPLPPPGPAWHRNLLCTAQHLSPIHLVHVHRYLARRPPLLCTVQHSTILSFFNAYPLSGPAPPAARSASPPLRRSPPRSPPPFRSFWLPDTAGAPGQRPCAGPAGPGAGGGRGCACERRGRPGRLEPDDGRHAAPARPAGGADGRARGARTGGVAAAAGGRWRVVGFMSGCVTRVGLTKVTISVVLQRQQWSAGIQGRPALGWAPQV